MPFRRQLVVLAFLPLLGCGSSAASPSSDSGATLGEGGSGGDDGPAGDGGAPGDDGGPGATCLTGTVSFQLDRAPGAGTTYCLGGPGSCSGGNWLSIVSADGGAGFNQMMGCVPDCNDCQPVACSKSCIVTLALGDAGAHTTWDGTYLDDGTCGASVACTTSRCAPAGSYIARMCGYPEMDASFGAECMGEPTPTCVDVPFVWPPPSGTSTVEGTIGEPSGDAGASD